MDIYNYSGRTGEFISKRPARRDPEDKDRFLIPANATTSEPPKVSKNEVAVFDGIDWQVVPDHRGEDYWLPDMSYHRIEHFGITPPPDAIYTAPPDDEDEVYVWDGNSWNPYEAPLSKADINAERDRRVAVGSTFDVTGVGKIPVAGDPITSRNMQGLAVSAQLRIGQGQADVITKYRDEDNVVHDLNQYQVIELWSKAAAYVEAVFQASWALKEMPTIPDDFAKDKYWP